MEKSDRTSSPHSVLSPQSSALAAVAVVTFLAFCRLCGADFSTWDDRQFIYTNPFFINASLAGVWHYWTHAHFDIYIPITTTVWMLLAWAGRMDLPGPDGSLLNSYLFHTTNVLVHVGAAVLALAVLRRLLKNDWAALAGALVFALHPVQVETVGWTSGLKDGLSGMFVLAALLTYLMAAEADAKLRRARLYWLAVLWFVLAMLAKPSAMTTVLLVLAIDVIFLRRPWKTIAAWTAPWVVLAIACAIVARLAQPATPANEFPAWIDRLLVVGDALAFYFGKIIWPAKLGLDYGQTPGAVLAGRWVDFAWLIPVALFLIAAVAWKRWREPMLGLLIFVLAPLHTLGFVPFDFQRYSTTADHYLYVAMLGIGLIFGWAIARLPTKPGLVVAGVVAAALGVRSFVQTATWHDSQSLFTNAIEVNPNSWAARSSLAAYWVDTGQFRAAAEECQRAIQLNPDFAVSYEVLGAAEVHLGDLAGATEAYRRAVELSPDQSEYLTNYGGILANNGRTEQARQLLNKAIALNPENAAAYLNLGILNFKRGDDATAIELLSKAEALAPQNPEVPMHLGLVLWQVGQHQQAAAQFQRSYLIKPDQPKLQAIMAQLGVPTP